MTDYLCRKFTVLSFFYWGRIIISWAKVLYRLDVWTVFQHTTNNTRKNLFMRSTDLVSAQVEQVGPVSGKEEEIIRLQKDESGALFRLQTVA
jgi:hypothetical protein